MELSALTFKLLFTFLPGIVSLIVIDVLTIHKKWGNFNYFLYSFVLGLLNYLIWFFVSMIPCFCFEFVNFFQDMKSISVFEVRQVAFVTVILSIPIGLIVVWIINHKFISRFANIIGVSAKIGNVDIFSYIFSVKEKEKIGWVVVRNYGTDTMYEGWVASFSSIDVKDKIELFLRDVRVYVNSTGTPLYETPGVYFAAERGQITIEFPNFNLDENTKSNKEIDK